MELSQESAMLILYRLTPPLPIASVCLRRRGTPTQVRASCAPRHGAPISYGRAPQTGGRRRRSLLFQNTTHFSERRQATEPASDTPHFRAQTPQEGSGAENVGFAACRRPVTVPVWYPPSEIPRSPLRISIRWKAARDEVSNTDPPHLPGRCTGRRQAVLDGETPPCGRKAPLSGGPASFPLELSAVCAIRRNRECCIPDGVFFSRASDKRLLATCQGPPLSMGGVSQRRRPSKINRKRDAIAYGGSKSVCRTKVRLAASKTANTRSGFASSPALPAAPSQNSVVFSESQNWYDFSDFHQQQPRLAVVTSGSWFAGSADSVPPCIDVPPAQPTTQSS